jgi:UDP:flavonoid glycosyltransferase YjiC (YdhE family)
MVGAGHQVGFATAERFCERVVAPAGFQAFPAGLSPMQVEERMASPQAGDGDAVPPVPSSDSPTDTEVGARMFAGVAGPAKVAELTRLIKAWRPTVIVHDALDFGAPVAAARAGLAWAGHSVGALQPPELWDRAAMIIAPTWHEWGVDPGPAGGMFRYLYLDICPPALQAPHIADITVARPLRPVIFDTPRAVPVPTWVRRLPPVPTVYVTLGTVFNHTRGLFETILEGLSAEAVNVIVTVGRNRDPAEVGAQPSNVRVERYIPQSVVFPRCDLVVCHGGSGTTLAALAHGLPLLVMPQGADQRWNGDRCAALGAGLTLYPAAVTPEAVRAATRGLLDQPSYRAAAGRIQAEINAMPGPEQAVGLIEELAGRNRPGA